MRRSNMRLEDILKLVNIWTYLGGRPVMDLGALEPLLWTDGQHNIVDLVKAVANEGWKVEMTTNANLLSKYAVGLKQAGLGLLRISWHSTNPLAFKDISGGHGVYEKFFDGVCSAVENRIPISFNRVILKSYCEDIPSQLAFIEKHDLRLKIYPLMWTPNMSLDYYQKQFVDWRDVIRRHVLKRTAQIARVEPKSGSKRLQFHLKNGGMVEVKLADYVDRMTGPCSTCSFKDECREDFQDYVRIEPEMGLYSCYMRRDLGFSLPEYWDRPEELRKRFAQMYWQDPSEVFRNASLRLTLVPYCNFNCRVPGTNVSWCMESAGNFWYPKMRPSTL